MAYEWGRLIWWLGQGQNGTAVQAIAAIAASVATVVLVGITGWYALMTRGLLRTSQKQLRALLQPDLVLEAIGTPNSKSACLKVWVKIANNADHPITLDSAMVSLKEHTFALVAFTGRVLSPGDHYRVDWIESTLPKPIDSKPHSQVKDIELVVICSDLAGVGRYEFRLNKTNGQRYRRL